MKHFGLRSVTACGLVSLALISTACISGRKTPLQIGLKRVALDLAFRGDKEDDEGRQVARTDIKRAAQVVPTGFDLTPENEVVVPPTVAPSELEIPDLCPAAPAGATPTETATIGIDRPPQEGVYPTRNEGTLSIVNGPFRFEGAYPPMGQVEIANVTDEVIEPNERDELLKFVAGRAFRAGEPGERVIEWDEIIPLGTTTTTTRYRVSRILPNNFLGRLGLVDTLALVRREIKTEEATFTFNPTPAVTLLALNGGEGSDWTSAGTDLETGATMTVQGELLARERVDACGTVWDSYRVQSSERLVMPAGGFTQFTDDTAPSAEGENPLPNFYNVATHLGGLLLRTETHRTTTLGPAVIEEDNVQTFNSAKPAQPKSS